MTLHAREINQDVRELGELLGDVLEAQSSTEAFEIVERTRKSSIEYRRGDAETRDAVRRHVLAGVAAEEGPPPAVARADALARVDPRESRALVEEPERAVDSREDRNYDAHRWGGG